MTTIKNPLADCIRVAGTLPAGVLLYRLVFYHRVLKRAVLNMSAPQWMEDTGLTRQQVYDAIDRLRTQQLITVEVKRFSGVKKNHFTLTERCRHKLGISSTDDMSSSLETIPIQKEKQEGPLPSVTVNTPYPLDANPESNMAPLKKPTPKKGVSVADVLAASAAKHNPYKDKPDNVTALGQVWVHKLADITSTFQPGLTNKALGQLKQFFTACPPKTAQKRLIALMDNWVDFVLFVSAKAGTQKVPNQPNIDFLTYHKALAVQFSTDLLSPANVTPKPQPTPKIEPVEPNPVQLIANDDSGDDDKPTLADILADPDDEDGQ